MTAVAGFADKAVLTVLRPDTLENYTALSYKVGPRLALELGLRRGLRASAVCVQYRQCPLWLLHLLCPG